MINLKDFFRFRQGPSLTISEWHKSGIYQDIRRIMSRPNLVGAAGATAAMALGVTLIELPYTAGFPIVWSSMAARHAVSKWFFALLLLIYLLIYLLDELLLFFTVLFTMWTVRMEEKHGRLLKLVSGAVMVALALALLIRPELMNSLRGLLVVFTVAIAVTLGAVGVHYATRQHRQKRAEL